MTECNKYTLTDKIKDAAKLLGVIGIWSAWNLGFGLLAKHEREIDPALFRVRITNYARYHIPYTNGSIIRGFDDNEDGTIDRITEEWIELSDNLLFGPDIPREKNHTREDSYFVYLEGILKERGHEKGKPGNRILGYMAKR